VLAPSTIAAAVVLIIALVIAAVASVVLDASFVRVALALGTLYALGTIPGSLLVARDDDGRAISWAFIRLIAGLLLSTIAFFLSLVLSLRWYVGPVVVFLVAIALRRGTALSVPTTCPVFTRHGVAAGLLAVVLMSPLAIAAFRMSPGDYAPVFFNVDTPYALEQVQSLSRTRVYPPQSLSNLGGRRPYHLAVHGAAALITRMSGLPPHQSLFLIVLPLLAVGIAAAAVVAKQNLCPSLPSVLAVPMLLLSVPSLWYSFWDYIGPRLWLVTTSFSIENMVAVVENYELWGVATIVAQNVGAHFVTLAAIASYAAVPSRRWLLPVFLIGSALIVKSATGIALMAGLVLAQAYRAAVARRFEPLIPAIAATAIFAATYVAFWLAPHVPTGYEAQLFPLFHLNGVAARDGLAGLASDLIWVLLPMLIVIGASSIAHADRLRVPLLLFGVAPFLVVNLTRTIDTRPGAGGATDDWIQILLPVPVLLHAFVLSVVGQHWAGIGRGRRVAVLVVMALAVAPAAVVAGRYSGVLMRHPEQGHEFVDNRSIAAALAAIPRGNSIIVTNDLRYPAQRFNRMNRQMQIPALFGHQAFAVNYAYEIFDFSRERRELQMLLQAEAWSDGIERAARTYRWTHLLIRKDYAHPSPIPLEKIFENESYAVYLF
jgi:hypothetical protein